MCIYVYILTYMCILIGSPPPRTNRFLQLSSKPDQIKLKKLFIWAKKLLVEFSSPRAWGLRSAHQQNQVDFVDCRWEEVGFVPKYGRKMSTLGWVLGWLATSEEAAKIQNWAFDDFPLFRGSLSQRGLARETAIGLSRSCKGELEVPTKHMPYRYQSIYVYTHTHVFMKNRKKKVSKYFIILIYIYVLFPTTQARYLSIVFKIYCMCMNVCEYVCLYTTVMPGAYRGQKKIAGLQEHHVGARSKPRFSGRTANVPTLWPISPALSIFYKPACNDCTSSFSFLNFIGCSSWHSRTSRVLFTAIFITLILAVWTKNSHILRVLYQNRSISSGWLHFLSSPSTFETR